MNTAIMEACGFEKEVSRVRNGKCPICNKEIIMSKFRDARSRREYEISGLCNVCQSDIFKDE